MFQLEGTKEENEILEKYLPNYKINLVDAERLEDVEKFSDDLQVILTMLRYRDSKEELTDYINENKKFFCAKRHKLLRNILMILILIYRNCVRKLV